MLLDGEDWWKGKGFFEISARRCEEASMAIFSRPRSSRRERIMDWISTALRRASPQNVHGPNPSFTQMTFPQFKQLGAAANRGCRAPMQLHFLLSLSRSVLFVLISRLRIVASSSERTPLAPCMFVPPVMFTFVFVVGGKGEDVREGFCEALRDEEEDFEVLKSDIKEPAAEGGARGVGACIAAGFGSREKAFLTGEG